MKYLVRYFHKDSWYGTVIYADSWEEAEEVCRAHNLQLDGKFVASVPFGWLASLIVRFQNLVKRHA